MPQRSFAALLLVAISSACGDGGNQLPPPSPVADPPTNPQDPPASTRQPPVNPNQPPVNPNQPQPNSNAAPSGVGGASSTGGDTGRAGNPGKAGAANSGPGNRCTQANGCMCDADCDTCKCALGNDNTICGQLCN